MKTNGKNTKQSKVKIQKYKIFLKIRYKRKGKKHGKIAI